MLISRAHVYRLTLTPEQEARLSQWIGAVRFVYNLAWEQRRDWYRPGRSFNFATQGREVTALRDEVEWIRDVPVDSLHQALRDLDRAYRNWWSGAASAPTPRRRGWNDAMRFPKPADFRFRRLSRHVGEVKIPKLGWVRLRWDNSIPGNIKNMTVSRRAGEWFASVQYEREIADPPPSRLPPVGIDRGVAVFAALSTGGMIAPLNARAGAMRSLARAQQKLARKTKGSNNRRKAVLRVAQLHARVARQRNDFLHKASTTIAKNHGVVVLEKLEVVNMVRSASGTIDNPGRNVRQKAGLNRSILDQGWGRFRQMLKYKLDERGGDLIEVNPSYTSQTCSVCGVIDSDSRKAQRFTCTACGQDTHADTNAAINILRRAGSPSLPVEAAFAAVEAGTTGPQGPESPQWVDAKSEVRGTLTPFARSDLNHETVRSLYGQPP